MNLLQLVLKQMRERALSTWLTLLSIVLGVALAISIMIIQREGESLFAQSNFGYEVLVGPPKGSALQLVLNTVYQVDASAGNVPYKVYEDLLKDRFNVKIAVPMAVGDSYKGLRIIGTLPKLFGVNENGEPLAPESAINYQLGRKYELASGKVFHPQKFEAVIGSDVPRLVGLKMGERFKATHGLPGPNEQPDEHDTQWTVVGQLKPTHTAADRAIYIPLLSFYAISEHEKGLDEQFRMRSGLPPQPPVAKPPAAPAPPAPPKVEHHDDHKHEKHTDEAHPDEKHAEEKHDAEHHHDEHQYELNPDGTFTVTLPKEEWVVSAIMVKARGGFQAQNLLYRYKMIDNSASAANPADEMRKFFDTFLKGSTIVLLLISLLVIIVAAVGILVAIYNSVSARMREIAILRALGATRTRILTIICVEAGLIGLIGGLAGAIGGHMIAALGSVYLHRLLGQRIRWMMFDRYELLCLLGVVVIAVLAGLVPALKAYRTPVATNLVAG